MKNRERLLNTSLCDTLCGMNDKIRMACDYAPCIMNGFMSNSEANKRCEKHGFGERCRDCISAWLNEEANDVE